jgi:hypothetical protein
LAEGWSLYRWGDGETAICRGKSISYQISNEVLARKLLELISTKHESTIHGLSWAYSASLYDKRWQSRKIFSVMFSTKVFLTLYHLRFVDNIYVETQVWYSRYKNLAEDLKFIIGNRPALLVASNMKFMQIMPAQTEFLECPSKDAFSNYLELCSSIKEWLKVVNGLSRPCILVAAGPTSKALVLDFRDDCQIIDIGHGFNFSAFGFGNYAWKEGKV